jgi:hypothetical protein
MRSFTAIALTFAASLAACDKAEEDKTQCPAPAALTPPDAPANIQAPAGATLALRLGADGAQIYTCKADAAGAFAWALKAPDAKLYDDQCALVGTHFAGPTWKWTGDDSSVVGMKVAESASPGTIPWLLLKAASTSGQGMMSAISYVQRVNTTGGVAPATGCDASTAGAEVSVPYTANYYFYKGGN